MGLISRLHPMLVHFPIALILAAAGAEILAMITRRASWRAVALANVRAGAAMSIVTVFAGWLLASAPFIEPTRSLALHRWTGLSASAAAIAAALLSVPYHVQSPRSLIAYQIALFGAAAFVGVTGHLGASLVWGPEFLWR
jgi:uncharacterized membrane protein